MGSLAVTQLVSLVLAVAAIGVAGGFIASAVVRRKKRRARAIFVLGFFCGLMAGSVLVARRRGQNTFVTAANGIHLRSLRTAIGWRAPRRLPPWRFPGRGLVGVIPPAWQRNV
jgi:hypothetical protein